MTRLAHALAAAALAAAPTVAAAQAATGVATARDVWQTVIDYVTRAAEQMPADKYGYRPVETVRTFGQLIGHIAGSQRVYCAAVLGDPPANEDAVEKAATTKAALVQALKESNAYCERAYAQPDAAVATQTTLFGERATRLFALTQNAIHDAEHYGNIVTYLRMNGMVPPSSQGR